jgi:hypothetical protein
VCRCIDLFSDLGRARTSARISEFVIAAEVDFHNIYALFMRQLTGSIHPHAYF